MIFWFSGTGNSKYVAERISKRNGLELASVAEIMRGKKVDISNDEIVGIVFPVYAWSVPEIVLDFVKRLRQNIRAEAYVFAVCTCGHDAGYSMRQIEKALRRPLDCSYSISMPSNYIVFDIDPEDLQAQKLEQAESVIDDVNRVIYEKTRGVSAVHEGSAPWIKSTLFAAVFNRFFKSARGFYANDQCTSCGICAKVCPVANVTVDGKPSWGKNCTQCFACIHHCPARAIQYGKDTESKGRYVNPNCKINYDFERR